MTYLNKKGGMGLSGVVAMLLLVTVVFLVAGMLNEDFKRNYYDTNISDINVNDTLLEEQFVNITEVNETFEPIVTAIKDIETSQGFFDKLGDASIALPLAVIKLPGIMLDVLLLVHGAVIDAGNFIGIPVVLIYIATVGVTIFFIFKIVEFWRRYPV